VFFAVISLVTINFEFCLFRAFLHYSNFNCDLTESVDSVMQELHELDGTTVVVDRATPKVF
jgi:hypothetical protein